MTAIGIGFTAVACLIHVYIFVLESLRWTEPGTMAVFGVPSFEVAETLKPMAFNQGFYNLFLAGMGAIGIVLVLADRESPGTALMLAGTGSMTLAGLVLLLSSPDKMRSALIQLVPASLAVAFTVMGRLA